MPSNVVLPGFHRFRVIQQAVGTTAVQLASTGFSDRNEVGILALAANTGKVYLGTSSTVSSLSGWELNAKDTLSLSLSTKAAIWAVATAAAQRVAILEIG